MKWLPFIITLLLPCLACTIADKHDGKSNDMLKAKSLKIGYFVNGEKKYLTVSENEKVKEILSTISIDDTDDASVGLKPKGTVDFIMADDSVIKVFFVRSGQLDRANRGPIYLKDTKFYEKINEVVSAKEGRKIDMLVNNK